MKIVFQIGKKMLLFLCAFIPVAEVFSVECNKTVPSVSAVCSEYDYIPQIDETEYYIAARKDIIVQGNTPFKRYGFAEDANSGETFVCLAEKNETVTTNYNLDDEIQLDVPESNPASDFEYELTDDNNGVRIKKYKGTNPIISIPSEIEGFPVVEISDNFIDEGFQGDFETQAEIQQVFIPDTVTEVGKQLFKSCKKLYYVRLSQNCKKISFRMFENCESLKSIQIPECVTTIEYGAFERSGLTSIQIPRSVTNFDKEIFGYCEELSSVKLPDTMTFIPSEMFNNCKALKTIELPSEIETLNESCFVWSGISEIKLPENLKKIENSCFAYCKNLKSIEIPESVETIGRNAFAGTSVTELIIPESVTEFDVADIDNLEVLRLPNSLKKIDRYLLKGSKEKLRSVNLPESLEIIEKDAFRDCENLTELIIPENLTKLIFIDRFGEDSTTYDSDQENFKGASKLPLRTQKRLKDLGYKGSFLSDEFESEH